MCQPDLRNFTTNPHVTIFWKRRHVLKEQEQEQKEGKEQEEKESNMIFFMKERENAIDVWAAPIRSTYMKMQS